MAVDNPGFEETTTQARDYPKHWTPFNIPFTTNESESFAGYGPGGNPWDHEHFDDLWDSNESYVTEFTSVILEDGQYDTSSEGHEDFEEEWNDNHNYLFSISSVTEASFDDSISSELFEDYEEGWNDNQNYLFTMGVISNASYDDAIASESYEDYEEGWNDNQNYLFTMGVISNASYDSGNGGGSAESVEDFEEVIEEFTFVVDDTNNEFTANGHGLSDGEKVTFRNEGGALPTGLSPSFVYYVISATANTFQVSTGQGGTSIDMDDKGTGTHFAIPDKELFWNSVMETL